VSEPKSDCDVRLDLALTAPAAPASQHSAADQLRHTLKLSRECLTALEAANCRTLALDKDSRAKLLHSAVQLARQVHSKLRRYAEALEREAQAPGPSTPR
jgi:hypothetical protein